MCEGEFLRASEVAGRSDCVVRHGGGELVNSQQDAFFAVDRRVEVS